MKKQIVLIAILCCTAFAQAQEVFVNADFVSSYIWRGIDSGNACIQPTLGLNWKGLTVYAWGSTEFRNKNNEIDLSLEYEYKNLTLMLTTILPRQKKNLSNISITVHTPPDILSKSEPDIYLVKSSRFPSAGIQRLPAMITGKTINAPGPVIAS